MEDKRKKRSPKVSLPQPPPPPVNPRKLSVLPSSKSATFSLGLPQPPSPKNRGKFKRSIGAVGQSKDVLSVVVAAPPKTTRFVTVTMSTLMSQMSWIDKMYIGGWINVKVLFTVISCCLVCLHQASQGEGQGSPASRAQ